MLTMMASLVLATTMEVMKATLMMVMATMIDDDEDDGESEDDGEDEEGDDEDNDSGYGGDNKGSANANVDGDSGVVRMNADHQQPSFHQRLLPDDPCSRSLQTP